MTAEMVDDVAKRHFPPCMRHLYEKLKGEHHLKHFARLQLGLFLKVSGQSGDARWGAWLHRLTLGSVQDEELLLIRGQGIGLPLDEAVVFWRRMYGSTMSDDKFNKEYKYNIRHGYGQEGKRTNYPPKK